MKEKPVATGLTSGEFLAPLTIVVPNNFHISLTNHLDSQIPGQQPGLHSIPHIRDPALGPQWAQ